MANKNGNCVILDKVDYLSEVHRQLSTYHYKQIENFDFKDLRMRLNSYLVNMHTKDGIDKKKIIELPLRRKQFEIWPRLDSYTSKNSSTGSVGATKYI